MGSLIYPTQQSDTVLWRAIILSVGLHALVVTLYPMLSQIPLPKMPERLEVAFFSIKTSPPPSVQQAPLSEVQPVIPPKATSMPRTKSSAALDTPRDVLAAPSSHESDAVPEPVSPNIVQLAPSSPALVTPSASSESAQHAAHEAVTRETKSASANTQMSTESDELSAIDMDAWGDYGEQLRALVSKGKRYPAIAIRRHLEGETIVVAQFVMGELVQVSLIDSSKHASLDEEAIRMVKKAIAQLNMKDVLKKKSFRITIPVGFKLE